MQTAGIIHDDGCAITSALLARLLVFGGIPRLGNFSPGGVKSNAAEIALERGHHAVSPVFRHDGDPVAGKVVQRGSFGGTRRRGTAAAAALSIHRQRCQNSCHNGTPDHQSPFLRAMLTSVQAAITCRNF